MPAPGSIGLGVSAIGIKEQVTRFTNMSGNFEAWKIAEIVNFCLQSIEDGAKASAPVLSGTLRDSISHTMLSEGFPLIAGECFVGVDYGAAVEFGYVGRGGNRVPGKNYFMPNAIKGQNLFNKIMKDYIAQSNNGQAVNPPTASRGKGKTRTHKYQSVQITSTGKKRYKYATDRGTISRRYFIGKPGGRKQPSTKFGRPKGGGASFRRG